MNGFPPLPIGLGSKTGKRDDVIVTVSVAWFERDPVLEVYRLLLAVDAPLAVGQELDE